MRLDWTPSPPLTVGLEWELQIADRNTLQPKDIFEDIYPNLPEEIQPLIHKEVYKSMLEIVTPPLADENEIESTLKGVLDAFKPLADRMNFHLIGLGSLFLEPKEEPKINLSPRYKRFAEEFQDLLKDFYIYGIHIHVGIPNAEWAVRAFNNLVRYAPLLLALSANTPFYRGRNTGIHSYRMVVFEKLPRAGLPQHFNRYGEFESLIAHLTNAGAIGGIKDLWWHIRPRPDYGTIEVRVFDSQWNLERIKFLVRLVRAIAYYSERYQDEPLPGELLNQNWWWAKRYSLDADFIDEKGRKALKQVAFDLLYKFEDLGILQKLGYRLEELTAFLRRPSPAKDISFRAKAVGLKKIVKGAAVV
ncbi:MAG TPA: YbdK family carboxylate-amine ligase [Aquifex sp.]|nr:YbdK family carboxylate-amine ligase [Aquifex sp.]